MAVFFQREEDLRFGMAVVILFANLFEVNILSLLEQGIGALQGVGVGFTGAQRFVEEGAPKVL